MAKRILIVDDSPELRELYKEVLEGEGYEVACAGNGREALEFLGASPLKPDLILLDIFMHVMDAREFRQHQLAAKTTAEIPVVIMSVDGRAKVAAEKLSAKDFYSKTTGIFGLIDVVNRHCADLQKIGRK